MNEEELKKGCGKRFCEDCGSEDNFHNECCSMGDLGFIRCGKKDFEEELEEEIKLCPICQAKLEGFQKGKLEERKEIVKLFYYEIHNNFVNFETLKKLVKLSEEISSEERK